MSNMPLVELVPAAAASLVTLAFKHEEGRFATWVVAEGIRTSTHYSIVRKMRGLCIQRNYCDALSTNIHVHSL
jgi:hypothetical protein